MHPTIIERNTNSYVTAILISHSIQTLVSNVRLCKVIKLTKNTMHKANINNSNNLFLRIFSISNGYTFINSD